MADGFEMTAYLTESPVPISKDGPGSGVLWLVRAMQLQPSIIYRKSEIECRQRQSHLPLLDWLTKHPSDVGMALSLLR